MAISAAGIIFSNLNENTASRLTSDRTVAAIPFACRYRLIDFCLSNMVNANISNINVAVNYNYRSLVEHIGSGKDWDLARRETGIKIISPYQMANSQGAPMFSSRLQALRAMREYIKDFKEDYVVLMDSDNVLNIDIQSLLKAHKISGAEITVVTERAPITFTSKTPRIMLSSIQGKITDIVMGTSYNPDAPEISLNIFVMKTDYLRKLIAEADGYDLTSLTALLLSTYKRASYCTFLHEQYVATLSSFNDYYRCSMELLKSEKSRNSLIFKKEFPIFTRVHNSAPTLHKSGANIKNSLIADECTIEGTVINSIIFRGVHIGKGAIVKDSILFHGTYVEDMAELCCIVTDKDVQITSGVKLFGNENMPFYVRKGRKV